MWRSRARLGLGAIVMALAWPAALVAASTAPADAGTLQVSPGTVQAGQETTLVVSFTAPASPPSQYLTVTLPYPGGLDGFHAVARRPGLPGFRLPADRLRHPDRGRDAPVSRHRLHARPSRPRRRPPAAAASFTAAGRFRGPAATLQVTAPAVTVSCPQDETGTMTVDPATDPAASSKTFTFTYTAGGCGAGPAAWSRCGFRPAGRRRIPSPGRPASRPGREVPALSVSGSMITVPAGNLEPGAAISFEYEAPSRPAPPGPTRSPPGSPAQTARWSSWPPLRWSRSRRPR